nr:replication-relaxation family protein [Burkholderia stabilis]
MRAVWSSGASGEPTLEAPVATASDVRMAQRTLRRLADARQVLRGQAPDGSVIYALSEAGARRLQHLGIAAATGKDLVRAFSSAHFRHRTIANEIAIRGILDGYRVSTEREIAQDKWLGGVDGIAGKKPDVLLRGDDGRVWLVEVERSRKNAKEYARLLRWLDAVASDAANASGSKLLGNGLKWGKVVFVCTRAFRAKLTRDLLAKGWKKSALDALIAFSTELYRFEGIVFA